MIPSPVVVRAIAGLNICMASSGPSKWSKYFANKGKVSTTIKADPNKLVQIFDMGKKPLFQVKDAWPINVLPMKSFNSLYSVETVDPRTKKIAVGLVTEKYVAKPIPRKISNRLASVTAIDFAIHGTKKTISYMHKDVKVLAFKDAKQVETSIIDGLKKAEGDKDAAQKAFKAFFSGGYRKIQWSSETPDEERSRYGVYIGEVLIGAIFLSGRSQQFLHPNPMNKKAKWFYLPEDVSFSGVDSITEFDAGTLLPVSNKFGAGAKASIFSNLLVKGLVNYKKMKPSVFRDLCEVAVDIGVTVQDLEAKRKSKDILYNFGVRRILKIPVGSGRKAVKDALGVFSSIKKGDITDDVAKVLTMIRDLKNVDPEVLKKLPNSLTSFFSRYTAMMLNKNETSVGQTINILAGKDYWQANLNIPKWQKGEVEFKMAHTTKVSIKFFGNKSAVDDLDAKQGMINYELKAS